VSKEVLVFLTVASFELFGEKIDAESILIKACKMIRKNKSNKRAEEKKGGLQ
jgi:hypothetical protein